MTYNFRIAAYNVLEAQNSFSGDILNFSKTTQIIAANAPDKITVFRQSLSGYKSGTVNLEWNAPENNGSEVIAYILTRDVGNGVFYVIYEGNDNFYRDIDLVAGETYIYKVASKNAFG